MRKPQNNVVHLDLWKKSKAINNISSKTTENEIEEVKATIDYLVNFPSFHLNKETLESSLDNSDKQNVGDISTILAFLFLDHLSELQGGNFSNSEENVKSIALFIKDTVNVDAPLDQGDTYLYEIKPEEIEYWKNHLASLEDGINNNNN